MANGKSRGPRPIGRPTIHWWTGAGPYDDPVLNALDHLRRYNFPIIGYDILPVTGFRLSREDRLAIDYLEDHGYTYHEDGVISAPTLTPTVVADVANGIYTLNGGIVDYGGVFEVGAADMPLVPGVGLQMVKELGPSADIQYAMAFTPAVFDAVNRPGGFTAAIEYEITNRIDFGAGLGAGQWGVIYQADVDWEHVLRGSYVGLWAPSNSVDEWDPFVFDYDIDNALNAYDYDLPGTSDAANIGTSLHSVGTMLRSYFGDDPFGRTAETTTGTPYPHPAATKLVLGGVVGVTGGSVAEKEQAACTITIKRVRLYTPAQPAGWVP